VVVRSLYFVEISGKAEGNHTYVDKLFTDHLQI